MKTTIIVALLGMLALCAMTSFAAETDSAEVQFKAFVQQYNKEYANVDEMARRLAIFKENLARLPRLRMENPLATFGVTQFFDMTVEEFKNYPCGGNLNRFPSQKTQVTPQKADFVPSYPPSWDWTTKGAVTPIKNQEQCGSCWAFSTVAHLEGAWFLAGHPLTSFAEQEFVDCSTESFGCGGGWPYWAMRDILKNEAGKVDTEASYPYTAQNGNCNVNGKVVGGSYYNWTSHCTLSTPACSEDFMAELLYSKGPLSACLNATPFFAYQSGILNPQGCTPTAIDHCIGIVGYGSQGGVNFWKIKNSWGTGWGEAGYVRLIRGVGACGINLVITQGFSH